jgi:hypothetical protein
MIHLPSNKKALQEAMTFLLLRGDEARRVRIPEWIISRAFLQGVRQFNEVDYGEGTVDFTWVNSYGKMEFRNEELLRYLQVEMGRMLGIDVRPSIKMKGWGLDRLRRASVGQVVLDYETGEQELSRLRFAFMEQLLTCGFSGVGAYVENAGLFNGTAALEIIPPWEIIPVPWNAFSPQHAEGYMRTRMVTLEWLKQHPRLSGRINTGDKDLEIHDIDWGELSSAAMSSSAASGVGDVLSFLNRGFQASAEGGIGSTSDDMSKYDVGRKMTRLTELWLLEGTRFVRRYVAMIGKFIAIDEDYVKEAQPVYNPCGFARYYPAGYFGRGFIGPLIPLAMETESALSALFQNMREWDSLGMLTLPTSLGISDQSFRIDERPKKVYYNPDPLEPNIQPGQIDPRNSGTMPRQVMEVATGYMDKIAGQSELFGGGAPGRADSAAAFGFLLETSNVGIEAPGNQIADAFSVAYSALLDASRRRMTTQEGMRVLNLEDMPVGVVITADGRLDLSQNPIPSPEEVNINIKSRTPPSPAQKVAQLTNMLQLQIIDPTDFRLTAYREGLELPVANEAEFQSWRKVRLNIRLLFNDGQSPNLNAVAVDTEADRVDIHLRELSAFMASPEFAMATKNVKNAFLDWKQRLIAMQLGGFPEAGMPPDQMAAMQAQQAGATPPGAPMM